MVSMEEDFGSDLCNSLETSHGVTEGSRNTRLHSFIAYFCLPWQRRYGKHLQRMSDKCSGGGIV